eukprot:SM000039S14537  [mRNA]  locus=s39:758425:759456:+ [translate_table: standard]
MLSLMCKSRFSKFAGTAAILQVANAYGLDVIVEVFNAIELEDLRPLEVPLYGVNLSLGLSLSLPGFREHVATSLIQALPFGAASVVGVRDIEEARAMRLAGADVVVLRKEMLQGRTSDKLQEISLERLLEQTMYAMTGDD